jgi:hypothetical protein
MHFMATVTLRASRMARWTRRVQQEFLDRAPENSMCIGLDCEYTDAVKNVKQKNLSAREEAACRRPATLCGIRDSIKLF